jgi:large subunit ribosomal protein L4
MTIRVPVKDMNGREVEQMDLPADIFEAPINVGLMHQYYVMQMANARLGTHDTKGRGEVKRSKIKWYRQKGTGRARHGNRSAPTFVGGGSAHGPHPHKYTKKMPKKMRRAALRSALSTKAAEDGIILIDHLEMKSPKTRDMVDALRNLVGDSSALVLMAQSDENVELSVRNLPDAYYLLASYLNVRDLLKFDKVIVPLDALQVITGWLGKQPRSE